MKRTLLCLVISTMIAAAGGVEQRNEFQARTNYCPQWSPDGRQIIFYSEQNERWRIMTINIDGSGMKSLSTGNHNDFYPSWSPSGDKILFYSDRDKAREIYIMNTDGSGVKRLTSSSERKWSPRWSPNGKRIAYVANEARQSPGKIVVMNVDGSNSMQLTNPEKISVDSRLAWSPDGKQIIFYSTNDGKEMSGQNQWALFSLQADGEGSPNQVGEWRRDSNPDWSGAAPSILFDAHKSGDWESDDGGWEIFSINPDGSNRKNLTNNDKRNDWGPFWSPDGKRIAYCSGMDDRYEIYIMNADGSNQKRLTHNVFGF